MAYDATSIAGLNQDAPAGTESKSLGDDAIREIKKVLKTSFPNSPIDDKYEGTLSQLTDLAAGATLPFNTIIMWSPTDDTQVPAGWTICDGRARPAGGNAPDLVSKFVLGALTSDDDTHLGFVAGTEGGNKEIDIRNFNGTLVEFTSEGHVLIEEELPNHSHALFQSSQTNGDSALNPLDRVAYFGDNVGSNRSYKAQPSSGGSNLGRSGDSGTNQAHSHKFSIDGTGQNTNANFPPYYCLLYLIKD